MNTNDLSKRPSHLPEQMLYMLNRAIDALFAHLGGEPQEFGADFRKGYGNSFKDDFEEFRGVIEGMMKDKDPDPHKLSAIALLAVLSSRPIVVSQIGESHSLNEVVAFFLAVYIIREYQLYRICGENSALRKKMEAQIPRLDELETPDGIYTSQEAMTAIVDSLCFLSRLVRGCRPNSRNANFAPILAVLMFYIDAYSFESIQDIMARLG